MSMVIEGHLGGNIDGGDPFTYCPGAWSYLVDRFAIQSVLDVGCAQGHAMLYFASLGCKVSGIEGLQANADKCLHPVIVHDIQSSTLVPDLVDLVWCCEVAEHIEEVHLPRLLTILSAGRIIAMTHAVPGQDGHHHVNCQEREYWITTIEALGYESIEVPHPLDSHNNHFDWHGLVFRRKS